jgi:hypothetical protein
MHWKETPIVGKVVFFLSLIVDRKVLLYIHIFFVVLV